MSDHDSNSGLNDFTAFLNNQQNLQGTGAGGHVGADGAGQQGAQGNTQGQPAAAGGGGVLFRPSTSHVNR